MSKIDKICEDYVSRLLDNYLRDILLNALYSILENDSTLADQVIISLLKPTFSGPNNTGNRYESRINIKNFKKLAPDSVKSVIPANTLGADYISSVNGLYNTVIAGCTNPEEFKKKVLYTLDYAGISNIYADVFSSRHSTLPAGFERALHNLVNLYPDFLRDLKELHELRNNKAHINSTPLDIHTLKSAVQKAIHIAGAHNFPQNSQAADFQRKQLAELTQFQEEINCDPISISELRSVFGFDEKKFKASILYKTYDSEKQTLYFCSIQYIESVFRALDIPLSFSIKNNINNLFSAVPELKKTGLIDDKILPRLLDLSIFTADTDFWIGITRGLASKSVHNSLYIEKQLLPTIKKKSASFFVDWDTFSNIRDSYGDKRQPSYRKFRAAYEMIDFFSRAKDNPAVVIGKEMPLTNSGFSENGLLRFTQNFPEKLFFVLHLNGGEKDPLLEEIQKRRIKNVVPVNLHYFPLAGKNLSPFVLQIQDHDYFLESLSDITQPAEDEHEQRTDETVHVAVSQESQESQEAVKTIEEDNQPVPETPQVTESSPHGDQTDSASYFTSSGKAVNLLSMIGSGGEGSIYKTDTGQAAKILKDSFCTPEREKKMKYQTENNPHISELCWPEDVLYDASHKFAGILMPCVSEYKEMSISVLKLGDEVIQKTYPKWNRLSLIELCIRICDIFDRMNRQYILMGDVNPRNILVNMNRADGSDVRFVDCDSFQVGEFLCPVGTIVFTNPEMYNRVKENTIDYSTTPRKQEDENYALAVLIFNILMLNQIPFAVKGGSDLKELMRNHAFAYSKPDYVPGENAVNENSPPDGPYELIWQNMIPDLRRILYSVFKEGSDVSAVTMKDTLLKYRNSVRKKINTDQLIPALHWERPNKKKKYKVFACDLCGTTTDMYYRQYEKFKSEGRPKFCRLCYSLVNEEMRTDVSNAECPICHNRFANVYDEWEANWRFETGTSESLRCFRCKNKVPFLCPSCKKTKYINKERLKKYEKPYCDDCNKVCSVSCEGWNCLNNVETKVWLVNQMHSNGKRILCNECREAIRMRKRY